jgi:uncharacterized membrane protein YgcG
VRSEYTLGNILGNIFEDLAIKTGTFKKDGADVDSQKALSEKLNINQPTTITLSYEPNPENRYYNKIDALKKIHLYPLSKFSDSVVEQSKITIKEDATEGFAAQWEKIYKTCLNEYSNLLDDAKTAKEVIFTVDEKTSVISPQEVLKKFLSAYVLTSAAKELYDFKKDKGYTGSEKTILDLIYDKELSEEDKNYLFVMIDQKYYTLNDKLATDVRDSFDKSLTAELKKQINAEKEPEESSKPEESQPEESQPEESQPEESQPEESQPEEKTDPEKKKDPEEKKNSEGSSNGSSNSSSGGSSGRSSGSSSSNRSSSIRTGSDSLLMLISSFGLSSGALLSLRKKK